jgi:hypothetical protein
MGGMSVVEVVRAADGKCYPPHPLDEAERNRVRLAVHELSHSGLSVRRIQRELAGRHGVRRAVGTIARDLARFSCRDCEDADG